MKIRQVLQNNFAISAWGGLPLLSVVASIGLLLVAVAYTGARSEASWSLPLFWLGLLLIYMPAVLRLASADASRRERIGLLAVLGICLYMVKVLHDPLAFGLPDEFMHWRTAHDILQTGHLFSENPILRVSPFYPGLENVTVAFLSFFGGTIFTSGIIVVGAARVLIVLALYLFCEQASSSQRAAGIAVALYMSNPSFMEIDAQYAYESLALPLAVWALWMILRQERAGGENRVGLNILAVLGILAVVATHHATSYMLAAFLSLWTLFYFWRRLAWLNRFGLWLLQRSRQVYERYFPSAWQRQLSRWFQASDQQTVQNGINLNPGGLALLALILCVLWMNFVAPQTTSYLMPWIRGGVEEVLRLITGESSGRRLFVSGSGYVTPLWERTIGFASVIFILASLPFGLWQIWQSYRRKNVVLALGVGALAYPLSLAFGLTSTGSQLAHRIWPFLYVAIAFVLAVGVTNFLLLRSRHPVTLLSFVVWATVIFTGGLISGWATWERLPGPYIVGSDTRSIEPQGVAAAAWAYTHLGSRNRIAVDRTNRFLMGSYGTQNPLLSGAFPVFFSPTFAWDDQALFRREGIQYVVFDRRLSRELPEKGVYIERAEPGVFNHKTPLDPQIFVKYDGLPNVGRLFDSGEILIYDVEALSDVP